MATEQKRITFKLPDVEYRRIQALSERTGRTMTDILREFIRTLLSAGATAQDIAETIQNTAVQPSSHGKELSKRF